MDLYNHFPQTIYPTKYKGFSKKLWHHGTPIQPTNFDWCFWFNVGFVWRMTHFQFSHFLNHFSSNSEWQGLIARQQKTELEYAASTYKSFDDEEDGYDDNYKSRTLFCHIGRINEHNLYIRDAVNIDIRPIYKSDEKRCFICALIYLYISCGHSQKEEFHKALLTIANKGFHSIFTNLLFSNYHQTRYM